jgi:hypothetical protein
MAVPGGGELQRRATACYAQLLALPRRLRRVLQRKLALPLAGVALLLALAQGLGQAATIVVDGTTCTLVDAIKAANTDTAQGGCPAGSGADVLVLEPAGSTVTLTRVDNTTYDPTGLPVVRSVVTIAGQGGTIRREPSAPAFRLLAVNDSGDLTLQDVTVTGGAIVGGYHDSGAVLNRNGTVTIQGSTISGNSRDGVLNLSEDDGHATMTLTQSTISGNSGTGVLNLGEYGGHATMTLTQSTISGNSGTGVQNMTYHGAADVTVIQSHIADNRGRGVSNVAFALKDNDHASATLIQSTISGNTAGGVKNDGGYEAYATMTLTQSTIAGNTASYGGGVLNYYGSLTLTDSTISGNTAGHGGGVFNDLGSVRLTHSTIADNTATDRGGGVVNSAGYSYYRGAWLTLTDSTISGNTAVVGGGVVNAGYEDDSSVTATLIQSTITGNTATTHGGGLYNVRSTLTLTTSIVAINRGGDCRNSADDALITSEGYNLDSDSSCKLTAPTDRPGVDPRLGPLQDNGGPTFTQALLPGSPALDAIPWGAKGCGTTLISDQRWQARPQPAGGACDIGAYEMAVSGQPLSGWVTGLTPHTVVCQNVSTGQAVTLSDPASPWDCEAAGLEVRAGDRVALRVHGSMAKGATDVGGAVVGMAPSSAGCTNLTAGQQVAFQHMVGATAGSCVTAGLVVHPGDLIQISVQGAAE